MPILQNSKHEKFAQLCASGLSGSEAYRRLEGPSAGKNADVTAARMMSKPGVRERVEELKKAQADKCELSRDEYRKSLEEILRAKPSEESLDNPLCDAVFSQGTRAAVFPSKLQTGAQLAKLVGWDKPTTINLETGDNLSAFLRRIVSQGAADQT
jgi:terminase small subunit-like protein